MSFSDDLHRTASTFLPFLTMRFYIWVLPLLKRTQRIRLTARADFEDTPDRHLLILPDLSLNLTLEPFRSLSRAGLVDDIMGKPSVL